MASPLRRSNSYESLIKFTSPEEDEDDHKETSPIRVSVQAPAPQNWQVHRPWEIEDPELPEELEGWQAHFLMVALRTFENFDTSEKNQIGVAPYDKDPNLNPYMVSSEKSSLKERSMDLLNKYLDDPDPELRGAAQILKEGVDRSETMYTAHYELLKHAIGRIYPSMSLDNQAEFQNKYIEAWVNLCSIVPPTDDRIKEPSDARNCLVQEKHKLRAALAKMQKDYQVVSTHFKNITADYLAPDSVLSRDRRAATIEFPNYFDGGKIMQISPEKAASHIEFYNDYATLLQNHQSYIAKFIGRTQELITNLDSAIALLPQPVKQDSELLSKLKKI